jgi:pimeloyl-ACP methyl ester carboxylesterase
LGQGDIVALLMGYPDGLHIIERPAAAPGAPTVVVVHGSLDRGESFRRVMRRVPELNIVAYDRRGYQGSQQAGVVGLPGHIDDLVAIVSEVRHRGAAPVAVIGHSVGGDVAIGAALAAPQLCDSVGAFEPPMPWLGFRRTGPNVGQSGAGQSDTEQPGAWGPLAEDPAEEVERFFSRMVSPSGWQRLSEEGRASRRADGPALLADLRALRSPQPPFDVMEMAVPSLFGRGGPESARHHREGVVWLASHVLGAELFEIEGAQHGAHLSHPDHFALFVRRVVERAGVA